MMHRCVKGVQAAYHADKQSGSAKRVLSQGTELLVPPRWYKVSFAVEALEYLTSYGRTRVAGATIDIQAVIFHAT